VVFGLPKASFLMVAFQRSAIAAKWEMSLAVEILRRERSGELIDRQVRSSTCDPGLVGASAT
jgi:hypothetical protein